MGINHVVPAMSIMLKTASGQCNLRCKYCFYQDETSRREVKSYGFMSIDTMTNILTKALSRTDQLLQIAFQGGEPTLAGLDFFKEVVRVVKENNVNHCRVNFALQTNGTLLDENWAGFLKENRFLVGVSLDGIKEIHDHWRVDAEGKGTYQRVVNGIRLLEKYGVDFNILTVLTKDACRRYQKIYESYKKNGWDFQQYIPCLDPLEEERGQHEWSLDVTAYENYLKTAFDCWYRDVMEGHPRFHRYFDNLLLMLNRQMPEACGMSGRCSVQYVVEADGSVYPCDFYMLDQNRLGNLNTDSFEMLDQKRTELGFLEESNKKEEECRSCQWYGLCRGGCRRDRDYFEKGIGKNYYCEAYRHFFDYAYPRLAEAYRLAIRRRT